MAGVTAQGAYTGTIEAATRVGWVFDAPLEYFPVEQLAAHYARPDAVRRRLAGGQDNAPLEARPPVVEILDPPREVDGGQVELTVSARSATRVDMLRVYVDGRPAAAARVCAARGQHRLRVPLRSGINRLQVVGFDERGFASNPAAVDVLGKGGGAGRPDVWVVAVGVDRYPQLPAAYQLRLAGADARGVAQAFAALAGPNRPYARARVQTLLDEAVTPAAVDRALAGLADMPPTTSRWCSSPATG